MSPGVLAEMFQGVGVPDAGVQPFSWNLTCDHTLLPVLHETITKEHDFWYPISDQTQKSVPYFKPLK